MLIKKEYIEKALETDISDVLRVISPDTKLVKHGSKKACSCPYPNHRDSGPSFFVYDNNSYYCFGCKAHGNVINLVSELENCDFRESVKKVLSINNSSIDLNDIYEKGSDEEEQRQKHLESLYIITNAVQKYFVSQYRDPSPASVECRRYAEQRWGEKNCERFGIGYAPSGNSLVYYLQSKGFSLKLACEAGVIAKSDNYNSSCENAGENPQNYYSFFRDRMTIPQANRSGKIQTWTARIFKEETETDGQKKKSKYINGRETAIYEKRRSLFGIDKAIYKAKQEKKVYFVEGSPDVLRLQAIGVSNAVAVLGGSLLPEQCNIFDSEKTDFCIIPDSDQRLVGVKTSIGINNGIANGLIALENGFKVFVKEIPQTKTKEVPNKETGEILKVYEKEDCDSYFQTKEIFDTIEEKPFVLWYAEKILDRSVVDFDLLDNVCKCFYYLDDREQEYCINVLKKAFPNYTASMWRDTVKKKKKELASEKLTKDSDSQLSEKYDFYERGNCYYMLSEGGKENRITNFVIKPVALISYENGKASRIFELKNENGEKVTVDILTPEITNIMKFREKIESYGKFLINVTPLQYEAVKNYLYDNIKNATYIKQMGFNKVKGVEFYAFANGVVYNGKWISVDEYGLVSLTDSLTVYLPATSKMYEDDRIKFMNERRFIHNGVCKLEYYDFFSGMMKHFGNNAMISLMFYVSALYKDIIFNYTGNFPILYIFGKKGSGKTTHATLLNQLNQKPDITSIPSSSKYAMGEKLQQVSNGTTHFDEYKNNIGEDKLGILKDVYNSSGRTKRSNDGEHREQTLVDCALILTGQEMPTMDEALFERCLFLEQMGSEYSKEISKEFAEFRELCNEGLTSITVELLKYREGFKRYWQQCFRACLNQLKDKMRGPSERLFNNWAIILASAKCVEQLKIKMPFSYDEIFEIASDLLYKQYQKCNTTDEVSLFWTNFATSYQSGEIVEGRDFTIKTIKNKLLVTPLHNPEALRFKEKEIVFICIDPCISRVCRLERSTGKIPIPDTTLKTYLMDTPEFLGIKASPMKFIKTDRTGIPLKEVSYENGTSVEKFQTFRSRPFCFDYETLKSTRDIDLKGCFQYVKEGEEVSDDDDRSEVQNKEPELPF